MMQHQQKPFENKVKKLLAEGKTAWGAGLPDASDVIARFTIDTGIDFLWIDVEHRPYDFEAIKWIPALCRLNGCAPIIRVAGLEDHLIKKALDIGASGVMIPHVNNIDEARQAVKSAKYPPQGRRGVSPWWTILMGVGYDQYLPAANAETLVSVEIETPEGIQNIESICQVEGVDVVFAGPTDLAAALGHIDNLNHPDVEKFLAEFPKRVNDCGKHAGISVRGDEASKRAFEQGYRFIVIGQIASFGTVAMRSCLEQLRKATSS